MYLFVGLININASYDSQYKLESNPTLWLPHSNQASPIVKLKAYQLFIQDQPWLYGNSTLLNDCIHQCQARLDIFYDNYKSIINYLNYMYFSKCFANIIKNHLKDKLTFLLRPDMIYSTLDQHTLSYMKKQVQSKQKSAFAIGYDSFGFVNDRFLASDCNSIFNFMTKIDYINSYLRPPWRYFHSEKYSSWSLRQRQHLRVINLPQSFTGKRVRASKTILNDCDSLNDAIREREYRKMFNRHGYWQCKLLLKKWYYCVTRKNDILK